MLFKLSLACLGFMIFVSFKNYWINVLKRLFEIRYKGKIFRLQGCCNQDNCVSEDWDQPVLSILFAALFIFNGFIYSDRLINHTLSTSLFLCLKWIILFAFASVAWFDAATGLIPDILNIIVFFAGFLYKSLDHLILSVNSDINNTLNIYAVGTILFIFSYFLSVLLSRIKLKLIGGGDIKFLAALIWMGFNICLYVLFTALILAMIMIVFTNHRKSFIRFGPYLSISASLFLLYKL